MSAIEACWLVASWKWPKLSLVPAGIRGRAAGLRGSNGTLGLMVSVAVPLAFWTRVNAAAWVVPVRCAGALPIALDRPAATTPDTLTTLGLIPP
jgi:hypothetical protein